MSNNNNNMLSMLDPRELTRAAVIRTAETFRWTRKMPKWRVVVNSRELPARPLVLEAAGVPPNNSTNSHQAVTILEKLGFETRYVRASATTMNREQIEKTADTESVADVFASIAQRVPNSDWKKVPTDLSKNVDHYLYGGKKVR